MITVAIAITAIIEFAVPGTRAPTGARCGVCMSANAGAASAPTTTNGSAIRKAPRPKSNADSGSRANEGNASTRAA
jgi:hypothetical protein